MGSLYDEIKEKCDTENSVQEKDGVGFVKEDWEYLIERLEKVLLLFEDGRRTRFHLACTKLRNDINILKKIVGESFS